MEPVKPVEPIKIGSAATTQDRMASTQDRAESTNRAIPSTQEIDQLKQGISRNWLVEPAKIEIGFVQSKGWNAR
ncbi:hypothetical protein D3C86_2046840 [compost metagenome]